jgi:hypothetical protein
MAYFVFVPHMRPAQVDLCRQNRFISGHEARKTWRAYLSRRNHLQQHRTVSQFSKHRQRRKGKLTRSPVPWK